MKQAVVCSTLLCAWCASACSDPDRGEVLLVVSTDLALPDDLNWLEWTIVQAGQAPKTGGIALDRADSLPATLAIVAGNVGSRTVQVHLAAKTGGDHGVVRVERDARFTVPVHGQMMLAMPLSWLCSDVNQPEACAEGTTCDAGSCVSADSVLVKDLPSHSATCFDVLGCTLVGRSTKQAPDLDGEDCVLKPSAVLGSPLNVALVVNTAKVGNAGVCAPAAAGDSSPPNAGSCFVPLTDQSPGGWDLIENTQGQTVIRLPRALCGPVMGASVASVAVTAQAGCAAKRSIEPLCRAPSLCVPSSASCPDGFPSTWSGYSCSGGTTPIDDRSLGLNYCGISGADAVLIPDTVRGHYCCTTKQAPSPDPLLIDDMSGGPLIKVQVPAGQVAGSWFTASDDAQSPLSPPQAASTLFTYRDVDPAVTPPGGPTISRAACFRMPKGFSGYYALEGFSFYGSDAQATPLDVSRFSGIRFWAALHSFDPDIPQSIRVVFPNVDTDSVNRDSAQSTCLKADLGSANCDHFGKTLANLGDTWQKYEVRWPELKQSGYGEPFDSFEPHVYTVDFQADGPGKDGLALRFDFCVSQISFIQ